MKTKVRKFPKMGRGLVAAQDFKKGQIVESSPVVILDVVEHKELAKTILNLYVFAWKDTGCALALGHGSLFNHSWENNVRYVNDYVRNKINFIATRDIQKGEQLFVDYGYDPLLEYQAYLAKREKLLEAMK